MNIYYVYVVKDGTNVLYVGHGKGDRHLHPTSGCSHVYRLNALHFQGVDVVVDIIKGDLTKEEARALELYTIKQLNPSYNTVGKEACLTEKIICKMVEYIVVVDMKARSRKVIREFLRENIRKWLNGTFILVKARDCYIFRRQPNYLKSFMERFPNAITILMDENDARRVKFSEEYLRSILEKVKYKK
jgi:hypothetical protein